MSASRRACEIQVGHLYVAENPFGEYFCTYCGDPADTRDHVLPLACAAALAEQILADHTEWRLALVTVPACFDCNSRLGSSFTRTVIERRKLLLQKLRKKFRRELLTVDWDETELAELGPNMRQYIEVEEARRRHIEARVDFAKSNGRIR